MNTRDASVNQELYKFLLKSWSIMRELQEASVPVVKNSVPVLYFGSLQRYLSSPFRVITVALNPSKNEFPDEFPSLRFPGAVEDSPTQHMQALNRYFDSGHHPLWREWFLNLDWLLEGMECGFCEGRSASALHTDMCSPIATDPTYSWLTSRQQRELERLGMPLWHELIAVIDPDVIVMSGGKTMRDRVEAFAGAKWTTIFGSGRKAVAVAEIHFSGRWRLAVFGWTSQVPFGALKVEERKRVGALIAEHLRSGKFCQLTDDALRAPLRPAGARRIEQSNSRVAESVPAKLLIGLEHSVQRKLEPSIHSNGPTVPAASYDFSRLCFRRDIIESIASKDSFRVITPMGTFQMTKAEFQSDFSNVTASKSYREGGLYHYPKVPAKAMRYRL